MDHPKRYVFAPQTVCAECFNSRGSYAPIPGSDARVIFCPHNLAGGLLFPVGRTRVRWVSVSDIERSEFIAWAHALAAQVRRAKGGEDDAQGDQSGPLQ